MAGLQVVKKASLHNWERVLEKVSYNGELFSLARSEYCLGEAFQPIEVSFLPDAFSE